MSIGVIFKTPLDSSRAPFKSTLESLSYSFESVSIYIYLNLPQFPLLINREFPFLSPWAESPSMSSHGPASSPPPSPCSVPFLLPLIPAHARTRPAQLAPPPVGPAFLLPLPLLAQQPGQPSSRVRRLAHPAHGPAHLARPHVNPREQLLPRRSHHRPGWAESPPCPRPLHPCLCLRLPSTPRRPCRRPPRAQPRYESRGSPSVPSEP